MCGKQWRSFFNILMYKEIQSLQPLLFPNRKTFQPVFQTLIIALMISSYITYKGYRSCEPHVKHIAPSGRIHNDISDVVLFKKLHGFFKNFFVRKPFVVTKFDS